MQSVLEEANSKLTGVTKDKKKYEALLTDLLVQSLQKLKQPATIVKVHARCSACKCAGIAARKCCQLLIVNNRC